MMRRRKRPPPHRITWGEALALALVHAEIATSDQAEEFLAAWTAIENYNAFGGEPDDDPQEIIRRWQFKT